MKAKLVASAVAAAFAVIAAHQASAQTQQPRSDPPSPSPVHVTVPPGGLTFNFTDIDRNGDKSISVEEWNAFVASLQSRAAGKDAGGSAASAGSAGATASERQPQQPQR